MAKSSKKPPSGLEWDTAKDMCGEIEQMDGHVTQVIFPVGYPPEIFKAFQGIYKYHTFCSYSSDKVQISWF